MDNWPTEPSDSKLVLFKLQIQGSQVVVMVKNLPANAGSEWVRSLGWEDPLGQGMATLSSILAWRVPWTEEPGGLQQWGCKESDMAEVT